MNNLLTILIPSTIVLSFIGVRENIDGKRRCNRNIYMIKEMQYKYDIIYKNHKDGAEYKNNRKWYDESIKKQEDWLHMPWYNRAITLFYPPAIGFNPN